nr:restriction endonuclease subunit S [Nitrosomonas nitrosa]
MAGEWQDKTWDELATLEYGKGLRGYEKASGQFRVFGTNGPIGWHDTPIYDKPSIIVGRKGVYRGIHYSPEPFFVIDTAFYLKPKTNFEMRWAYYELLTHDINGMDSGSAIPSTSRESFYTLPVRLPPPDEQRAIAHILGTLDDKIELNRRMNETLEAIARAMFKSWFIDFDPVRAKASGEPPESICRRLRLTPDLLALFPDRFVDSELGEIPEGWEVKPFSETVQIIGGGTPKTSVSEYWGGDIPWFSVVDAPAESDVFVIDTEKKITQTGLDDSSARILSAGTTIISARGTVGKVALVGVPMAMNQSCYGLRGLDGGSFFTYYATRELVSTLKQHSHGAVFDTITRNTFAGVSVVTFQPVVTAFETVVTPLMEKIKANSVQGRTLAELRDTLLPKLLSGELRVPVRSAS